MKIIIYDPEFSYLEKFQGAEFITSIKKILKTIKIKTSGPDLPPITRSIIGYIGYECMGFF